MSTRILSAAIVSVGLLVAGVAGADVVPPEPTDCPEGSIGATCHGGPFCRPADCTTENECQAGEVCVDADICISTIDCGGIGGPSPVDAFEGVCEGGACTVGTCESRKVCMPVGGTTASSSAGTSAVSSGSVGASTSTTAASGGDGGNGGSGGGAGSTRVDQGCGCELVGGTGASRGWWWLGALALLPFRRRR